MAEHKSISVVGLCQLTVLKIVTAYFVSCGGTRARADETSREVNWSEVCSVCDLQDAIARGGK